MMKLLYKQTDNMDKENGIHNFAGGGGSQQKNLVMKKNVIKEE